MKTVRSAVVPDRPGVRRRQRAPAVIAGVAGLAAVAALSTLAGSLGHPGLSPIATVRAAQSADPTTFGRDLAGGCSGCHNTNGRAIGDGVALAGMPADRLVQLMTEFRDGKRPATVMHQIAKGYTPEQIQLIAAWLAAQSPK